MSPIQLISFFMVLFCVFGAQADESAKTLSDHSHLKTRDPLSMNARGFFSALQERDYPYFEEFFADSVRAEINGDLIEGKDQYIARLKHISNDLFYDMEWVWLHVHTNYFAPDAFGPDSLITNPVATMGEKRSESTIWSNSWTFVRMKGNYTGNEIEIPMHLDFRWSNGRVVHVLGYYDPSALNKERAAWKLENSDQ